jgi:hypothetical protein
MMIAGDFARLTTAKGMNRSLIMNASFVVRDSPRPKARRLLASTQILCAR